MLWRDSKGAQPLWSGPGQSPTAYAKSQIIYEVVCYGDEKWGSGSPFFQKTSVISTRLTYTNIKSIVGSKGLEPLGGVWGRAPKNFAYTVGKAPQKNLNAMKIDKNGRKTSQFLFDIFCRFMLNDFFHVAMKCRCRNRTANLGFKFSIPAVIHTNS